MEKQYKNFPFPLPDESEEPKEERRAFIVPQSFGWGNLFIIICLLEGLYQFIVLIFPSIASTNIPGLFIATGGIKILGISYGIFLIITAIGLNFKKKWALYFVFLQYGYYALKLIYNFIIFAIKGANFSFSNFGSIIVSVIIGYLWVKYFYRRRNLFGASYELNKKTITRYIICVILIFLIILGGNFFLSKHFVKTDLNFISSAQLKEYTDPVNGITMKYPSNWLKPKIMVNGRELTSGELVSFSVPPSITNSQPTQVVLQITKVSPQDSGNSQSLSEISTAKMDLIKSYGIISEENPNTFLAERPAYSVTYGSGDAKIFKIWFIENNKIFEMTYSGEKKSFDKFFNDAQNIIDSLTVRE
jgi:hypothetical protein